MDSATDTTSTSPFEIAVHDKNSTHPYAVVLLGEVVAVEIYDGTLILHYQDGHNVALEIENGAYSFSELVVPRC